MAIATTLTLACSPLLSIHHRHRHRHRYRSLLHPLPPQQQKNKTKIKNLHHRGRIYMDLSTAATNTAGVSGGASQLFHAFKQVLYQFPPSWQSSIAANALIFVLGFPLLKSGLTFPGIASAFLLGTLTWKAFGPRAFLLVVFYFLLGTAVTKVKINQKEKEGIAEKRRGKRGPSSVWGSSAAGVACAIASLFGLGGSSFYSLWKLGYVASFATKLSDTVSSEIGKAYGKSTYLVTTLKPVPRGTEGAISMEGTLAGLSASFLFCALACSIDQITAYDGLICLVSSQIANLLESYVGATVQDKKGFEWLNNDVVNVLNISVGAIIAVVTSAIVNP